MASVPSLNPRSDWVGVVSASLCVVHCLLTPMLITLAANFGWWPGVSYLFLIVGFYAAYETSQHSSGSPWLWVIWISFALLTVSIIFEDDYETLELLGYVASAGLVVGHVFNIRFCKKCPSHDC